TLDEVLRSRQPSWMGHRRKQTPRDYFGQAEGSTPSSPDDHRKQAIAMRSQGYTALKFDLDVPGAEGSDPYNRCLTNRAIDCMVALIGAVHEAVGRDTDIAGDCHWRYSVSDVVKVSRALESFLLLWLDYTVYPSYVVTHRLVRYNV